VKLKESTRRWTHPWVVLLRTTSRMVLQNQNWQNHFLGPFHLNFFTTIILFYFSCLSIAWLNRWLEFYFGMLKMKKWKNLYS
jgi:hypothetical protein